MRDFLPVFWSLFDDPEAAITFDELNEWPEKVRKALSAGLLDPLPPLDWIVCNACDDRHSAELVMDTGTDGDVRFYHACSEAGRVLVEAERRQQWRLRPMGLLDHLVRSISEPMRPETLIDDRLWRIGYHKLDGQPNPVHIARGLQYSDTSAAGVHLPPDSIVIVPTSIPGASLWFEPAPRVVRAGDLAVWRRGYVALDWSRWPIALAEAQSAHTGEESRRDDAPSRQLIRWQANDHRVTLTSREWKFVQMGLREKVIPISDLFQGGRLSFWNETYDKGETHNRRVATFRSRLNTKLEEAEPPVPITFTVDTGRDAIVRC